VAALDRIHVDDPVEAVPVHGINGIWSTLAVGLFHTHSGLVYGGGLRQLAIQALGALCCSALALVSMGAVFFAIKKTVGLRVSREEELRGLDISEHGMESYWGFQIFVTE